MRVICIDTKLREPNSKFKGCAKLEYLKEYTIKKESVHGDEPHVSLEEIPGSVFRKDRFIELTDEAIQKYIENIDNEEVKNVEVAGRETKDKAVQEIPPMVLQDGQPRV
jgi:hypothetical protein